MGKIFFLLLFVIVLILVITVYFFVLPKYEESKFSSLLNNFKRPDSFHLIFFDRPNNTLYSIEYTCEYNTSSGSVDCKFYVMYITIKQYYGLYSWIPNMTRSYLCINKYPEIKQKLVEFGSQIQNLVIFKKQISSVDISKIPIDVGFWLQTDATYHQNNHQLFLHYNSTTSYCTVSIISKPYQEIYEVELNEVLFNQLKQTIFEYAIDCQKQAQNNCKLVSNNTIACII